MLLLIIADETESSLIRNQLKNVSGITSVLKSNSAEDALFVILEKEPSIIIVSNLLQGRSGFELAYLLQKINFKSYLIILSNKPEDAIDAIKANVFDYLVYPFAGERLVNAVQKALIEIVNANRDVQDQTNEENMKVRLSVLNGFILVDLNKLSHCIADGSYTKLYFNNGKTECSSYHLGKIENILKEHQFLRINRSMIINMKMLKEINEKGEFCKIDTGSNIVELKISKFGIKKFEEKHLF